jgi:hypothetical protein
MTQQWDQLYHMRVSEGLTYDGEVETNQDGDRLCCAQLALGQRKVLVPLRLADSDRVDVHDIVSAGMRATMEALARVKTRIRGIKSDQRPQKWVSEVGIDIMLIAVNVNLHSYWSAH